MEYMRLDSLGSLNHTWLYFKGVINYLGQTNTGQADYEITLGSRDIRGELANLWHMELCNTQVCGRSIRRKIVKCLWNFGKIKGIFLVKK